MATIAPNTIAKIERILIDYFLIFFNIPFIHDKNAMKTRIRLDLNLGINEVIENKSKRPTIPAEAIARTIIACNHP